VFAIVTSSLAKTGAKPQKETLSFDAKIRTYYVFAPTGLAAPAPVLLLLHGSGQDGMSLIEPWRGLAQEEGIILVAPNSSDPAAWDQRKDGADFLHAVLTKVESKYAADTKRVYLFGHSGGAMYALYLSLLESEYFAATAIHAGALLDSNFKLIDSAKRKIPISIWVGTADQAFPLLQVKATRDAFQAHGFTVDLHEIPGHDHNYYAIAGAVNRAAWQFLEANKLEKDAEFYELTPKLPPPASGPSVWANAKPYLDDPVPQLTASIPELRGLKPAPDQEQLAGLLEKTSDKCQYLLRKTPNVISHESVVTEIEPWGPSSHEQFEYMVLRHDTNGEVTLDEYRTDKGKPGPSPLSQGTANVWVVFHPGNLVESRFRYLGRQQMDGHNTFVLLFAQIPDRVKFPGQVRLQGKAVPVFYQGVAWVDESDFRIVRLRTDLLASRLDISLRTLTSEVRFSQVRIRLPEMSDSLWLPHEAKITWDYEGRVVQQLHQYSNFRLYRAKSRITM
jgi:poly(3-hydroxybutyrate) depolymerase